MKFRSLASKKWLNIKVYSQKNERRGKSSARRDAGWPFLIPVLAGVQSLVFFCVTVREKTCRFTPEHVSSEQSQGWNVPSSHLASLASFETELSVSLPNNGESNTLHYLWFQHASKAPPAAGLRTLWGVYWLQAAQLAPLAGHFHRRARKCLCPLNSPGQQVL